MAKFKLKTSYLVFLLASMFSRFLPISSRNSSLMSSSSSEDSSPSSEERTSSEARTL